MVKKFMVFIGAIIILLFSNDVYVKASTGGHSADDAINWVKSKVGTGMDYDGVFGKQCVDLICYYYQYLGQSSPGGNGCDYATNALPSGWQRIQGAQPQKGDILVYSGTSSNPAGHVAIYESDRETYHQNFDYHQYVEKITYMYNGLGNPYWGVIRPDFIANDTENPKTTRTYISEITRDSYRVCAEVSDNVGIDRVSIATWTKPDQSDIIWRVANYNGAGTYYVDINRSEHSEIINWYYNNHIYVYDYAGNYSSTACNMDYRITSDTGQNISEGEYRIVTAMNTEYGLDIEGGSVASGTNVQIRKNTSDSNQTFNISYVGNGFYKIIGIKSELALDVYGGGYQLGTNVKMSTYHEGENQQWMFKELEDGIYSIVSQSNGLALDFYNGICEDGTNVQVHEQWGGYPQRWKLKRVLNDTMVNCNITDVYLSNCLQQIDKIDVTVDGMKLERGVDYEVSCILKDGNLSYVIKGIGNYSDEVVKTYELSVESPELTVTGSLSASTIEAGKTLTITGNASGGTGDYTYSYLIYNPDTNAWYRFNKTFTTSNTYNWTASGSGNRIFYVEAKDGNGTVVRSSGLKVAIASGKDLSIIATGDKSIVTAGEKVTIKAIADGGTGSYTYSYLIYNPVTKVWHRFNSTFTTKNINTWTATGTGTRKFYAEVKDSTGKVVRSEAVNVKLSTGNELAVNVMSNKYFTSVKDKITLTATGKGGSGSYTYSYLVWNTATDEWHRFSTFKSAYTLSWTASSAGNRNFYAEIKDSTGKVVRSNPVKIVTR